MILGMDLSLSCPAFCVAEVVDGKLEIHHLSHIKTDSKKTRAYRLWQIYNHLKEILSQYPQIKTVIRERGFTRFNQETQALFSVVGVTEVILYKHGFDKIEEIAPTTVKKLVAGSGKADKEEVAVNARKYLKTEVDFKTNDESDAVAVILAYLKKQEVL
jgi:crossover junction endodeoxyribonuclease RuvC